MENKAHALVKALKSFRVYILHSKIISYVRSSAVKKFLFHVDNDGKRGRWINFFIKYDMETKVTRLIKGQGLTKLLEKSICEALGINLTVDCSQPKNIDNEICLHEKFSSFEW